MTELKKEELRLYLGIESEDGLINRVIESIEEIKHLRDSLNALNGTFSFYKDKIEGLEKSRQSVVKICDSRGIKLNEYEARIKSILDRLRPDVECAPWVIDELEGIIK